MSGQVEVRNYWRRQWDVMDPRVEPIGIEGDETDQTVVAVQKVVRDPAGNIVVNQIAEHVYSIRDGLIERMDIREPNTKEASPGTE